VASHLSLPFSKSSEKTSGREFEWGSNPDSSATKTGNMENEKTIEKENKRSFLIGFMTITF